MSNAPDPCEVAFESYGVMAGLRVPNREVLDLVMRLIPSPWQVIDPAQVATWFAISPVEPGDGDPPSYGFQVFTNEKKERWVPTLDLLADAMESTLHLHVAEWATPWVFLHAGVVAIDGRAIVLPATSMSGKSTLVHALVESGATYYSDEYAILDTTGRVWPFRRALSLREGPFGEERRVPRNQGPEPGPIPVGLVAFLSYQEGAALDVRPITASEATMLGAMQSVGIRRFPERTMQAIITVTGSAARFEGTRGDYQEAVDWIHGILSPIRR